MIKPACIALLLWILLLGGFMIPHRTSQTMAFPENLWTASGQWANPSSKVELIRWKRTNYGYPWSWLVYDRGITEPAWYLRVDSKYLLFYIVVSTTISTGAFMALAPLRKTQKEA